VIAKIKPSNKKIFKGFSITTLPINMNSVTKAQYDKNVKIQAKISDFTVFHNTYFSYNFNISGIFFSLQLFYPISGIFVVHCICQCDSKRNSEFITFFTSFLLQLL
jgi:hypothetical protein